MKASTSILARNRPMGWLFGLVLAGIALSGCTITTMNAPASTSQDAFGNRQQIEGAVNETLQRLYRVAPGSREMAASAAGVLVFPQVIGGAIIVGGEHGRGALRVAGRTTDYYSVTGASVGWQLGGQSRAVV